MEKKILSFLPAALVQGKTRWYIKFHQTNPLTGKRQRFRFTFELNRIKGKRQRIQEARRLINEINAMLPVGYPYTDIMDNPKAFSSLEAALRIAERIKCDTDRGYTVKDYKSCTKIFLQWAAGRGYDQQYISKFTKGMALEFLDYVKFERGASNRTYNNYIIRTKALFYALVDREYITENPFKGILPKRNEPKKRRPFEDDEKKVVAEYIKENHYWLYLALLLQFYCYIRPIELTRLRFKFFNLNDGTIDMPADTTKSKKRRIITIPLIIIHHFFDKRFTDNSGSYLLFGDHLKPAPGANVGEKVRYDRMYKMHKRVLRQLQKAGTLQNIDGLTWYSWKDTGATDSDVSIYADMQQMGHADPRHTLIYRMQKRVNGEVRDTKKRLT